jgi:hypothetical protein
MKASLLAKYQPKYPGETIDPNRMELERKRLTNRDGSEV